MASISLGQFNGASTSYGNYNSYFQYDGAIRDGTNIILTNCRLYFERISSGYTTNRLATSGSIAGQINWSNVTLNSYGSQSPASMTYGIGTVTITGVPYTTNNISLSVQAKGTGGSSDWNNTSGTVQLNYNSTISVPVINISTVTATDSNIESATSININRYASNFIHKLYYKFSGQSSWTLIAENVGTSYGWVIPLSVYSLIPNDKSIICQILCETYNGSTLIGSNTTQFTASVNESINKPIVSATITDINSKTVELTGDNSKIVKYISNVRIVISSTAKNSSTISSQKVACGDGKTSSLADNTLNAVESGIFTVEAIDSRGIKGYTDTYPIEKQLIPYVKLTLNTNIYRTNPTNNEIAITFNGNYFNDTFGTIANTLTIKWRYREKGSTTWSSYQILTTVKSNNTYSNGTIPIVLGTNFNYQKQYEFEVVALDKIYTADTDIVSAKTVAQGKPNHWWNKIGMYIEEKLYARKGFEVNGEFILNDKTFLERTYPVGSIYMSISSINPTSLFGGTWVAWGTGRVPVAIDTSQTEFSTVEKTGGSKFTEAHQHPFRVVKDNELNSGGGLPKANNSQGANSGWSAYVPAGDPNCAVGTFGTGNSGNLQPYITCYMWKRTV